MKKLASPILNALSSGYHKLSVKGLSLAVSPTIMGELPSLEQIPTFYILDDHAAADRLLLEYQLSETGLPSALNAIHHEDIQESAATIFLKRQKRHKHTAVSPRLQRLVNACLANPQLHVQLVPVTILWGRVPDKEESIFKLLMTDEWRVPSIGKQLFNIGVMGRDTFVQFYQPKSLQKLISDAKAHHDNPKDIALAIHHRLQGYLLKQRTSILGPDLSDRRNISDSILQADGVQNAIMAKSTHTGKPIATIKKEAQDYINEIASDYSYAIVRVFERFLTWLWTQLYDGVQVRHFDRVRHLAPDYQIIYVPCHRSHMDYLLLSYVIHNRGLRIPHVAAGANLNLPILGEILRAGGAFFLRRSFRDNPLYGAVLKAYLHSLMQRSAPIEYFIEGGRSRSGRLLAPKLGMLAMTVHSYLSAPAKPVVFIPTYISYERIMEGATYVGELKGKPKESENLLQIIKTAQKIERIFGTVHLSFGEPLYLDNFLAKFDIDTAQAISLTNHKDQPQDTPNDNEAKLAAMIQNLGVKIMQHINKAAVVNPVSLVALVLLSAPKAALDKSHLGTQLALYQRIAQLLPYDDDTAVSDMSPEAMIDYVHKLKLITITPHILGDMIQVADKQAPMLSYFRNNILHIFILPSLLAALIERNGRISLADLHTVGRLLYPFLQAELFLKYGLKNIDTVITHALQVLIDTHLAVDLGDNMIAAPDGNSDDYQKLVVLASPAQQSLERYFMTLTLLAEQGTGKLSLEQVVELCHLVGQRISVLYGDDLPDVFDKALFSNFVNALIRSGYVHSQDDRLHFDERIHHIAHYARFVLPADTLTLLHHATHLSDDELASIKAE